MPKLHFKNQATTILAEEIGANDEVLTIRGADAGLFPKDEAFLINITDQKNPADFEIILVRAVEGSTWNISRGWEGTQAQEWQEGVLLSLNNSAFILNNSSQFGMPPEWHERYAAEVGYPIRSIISSKVDGIYWISVMEANPNDPETGNGWEKIDLNVLLAETHNSVPYYPRRLVAPQLSGTAKPMLNDPQPEAENATEKGLKGRYWYLYTRDIEKPVTSWFEFQEDPSDPRGFKDNGIKISGEDRNLSIMTGCAVEIPAGGYGSFKEGECLYFLSCQNESGSQGIELWTAPDADTKPTYKSLIFSYTQTANRDPMVRLSADGTKYRMARTTAEGIAWATSTDLENWNDRGVSPISGFSGLEECCDFNEGLGYIICGNYTRADNNTPPTSRTIYAFGSWQNDIFVSNAPAKDIRNNCLDLGPDYYAARGTSGMLLGWINNWTYAKQLTIPNFNGFLGTPRQIVEAVAPDGTKILYSKPIERNWANKQSSTGISVKGSYSPIPFKFMPPAYELNVALRCNSKTWPQSIKLMFGNGASKNYTISVAAQGNTQEIADGRDGKPCVEVTKDTYGSWPYGDLGQWNNYFRVPLQAGEPINLKIIVDRGSAEVFINGQYALSMLVLWGEGAPEFYVKCSEGTDWQGNVKTVAPDGSLIPQADVVGDFDLLFDEMPSYVDSSLDYREVIGLPELFNPWSINTYRPDNDSSGKETGKPFYQMTWLDVGPLVPDPKDPTGKTMTAGPPGVYLKYTYDPSEIPTPVVPLSVIAPDGEAAAILKMEKEIADLTIIVNQLKNAKQQGAGALALKTASLQNGGVYG